MGIATTLTAFTVWVWWKVIQHLSAVNSELTAKLMSNNYSEFSNAQTQLEKVRVPQKPSPRSTTEQDAIITHEINRKLSELGVDVNI